LIKNEKRFDRDSKENTKEELDSKENTKEELFEA